MVITDFLERNAKLYAHETALVEINPSDERDSASTWMEFSLIESAPGGRYRRELSWFDFDKRANRFANLLLTRGVRKGDKVGILMMNCLEWLPVYFGILKTGALVVPLNFRYTADEIKYCADLADLRCLVFGPEFIQRLDGIVGELDKIKDMFFVGEKKDKPDYADLYDEYVLFCSTQPPAVALDENDNAAIYFSSGTTGRPKAILHAHKALVHSCKVEQNHHGQTHDDVFLCIPPLYHTGAKMHWFGSLISGSRAVLLRGVKPEWILRAVSEEKATIVWLLVPWAQDLLDALDSGSIDISKLNLSQWRLMHIGAQPVPPSLIKRWFEHFPNHKYDTNYGLSESIGPGCVHLGVENPHKVGAIGKAGYGWQIKIIDEKGNPVKQGEVGELAVYGDGVMKCYYKNPEATQEILHDGWLSTGDMAREDEDGFIFLVDRKKDVVISGGENIYPVEIEDFLRTNIAIKDAAVIGIPDERLGETTAAIIEVKNGCSLTVEELNEFCKALPRYKRPHKIILADIPRNPTGKIEKPVLRKRYGGDNLITSQTQR